MLWLKSFHIVMVVSWFAGLFYLPRIFVNLAMETHAAAYDRLLLMAHKLYRFVTPIMWLTLATGTWLWLAYFPLSMNWMWAKLVLVAGLVAYHHVCKGLLRAFDARQNGKSHKWFRWFNE
ncbi:MAG: CopD family protein, partial [Thiobacillus sp.]